MENKKLDQEFKNKWIAALRSGRYKQGREELYNCFDNSYCCLGVACEIAHGQIKQHDDGEWIADDAVLVPEQLRGNYHEPVDTLTNMNDNGVSFAEIADWIEEHL